ncbi:MAG: hypothetical protein HY300_04920, partial [Verrucomicrobia bacterium]|nr:hypothetical protein [Verrucomicrobiota bacterium]
MAREGFDLYSSWPHYRDMLEVHWFKKNLSREEWLRKSADFIARSRLSHLFGRRHFLARAEPGLDAQLWQMLTLTDELVDTFDDVKARQCAEHFAKIASLLKSDAVLAEPSDTGMSLRTLDSYQRLMPLLIEGKPERLVEFCNADEGFIRTWGMPSHFAVFQKAAA